MGSSALNSSCPDGLNSEKKDSPPQLTNRSPFLVVCALPVAAAVRPSDWFTDLISVAVSAARFKLPAAAVAIAFAFVVTADPDEHETTAAHSAPVTNTVATWNFTGTSETIRDLAENSLHAL